MMKNKCLLTLCLVIIMGMNVYEAKSQIRLYANGGVSLLRKSNFIPNTSASYFYSTGFSFLMDPFVNHEKLKLQMDVGVYSVGYKQTFSEDYLFRLQFGMINPQLSYTINEHLTFNSGLYVAGDIQTSPKGAKENYGSFDWGLTFSLNAFETKRIGLNILTRCSVEI